MDSTQSETDRQNKANSDLVKQTSRILIAIETVQSILVFLAAIAGIVGVLIWVAEGDKREEERILRRIDTSNLAQSIINEMPQDWAGYQAGDGPGPQEQALALKAGLYVRPQFQVKAVAIEADCGGDGALSGRLAFSGERFSLYDCEAVGLTIQAQLSDMGGGKPYLAFHNVNATNLSVSDVGIVDRILLNEGVFDGLSLDLQGRNTKLEFYGSALKNTTIRSFDAGKRDTLVLEDGIYETVKTLEVFIQTQCSRVGKSENPVRWKCKSVDAAP